MKKDKINKRTKRNILVIWLFIISLIFVLIAASVGYVGFNYMQNRKFKETFYCVSSLKVNNRIRVVQISDLHNCSYGNNNEDMINRIEKLKPDLIIYTGDCIDTHAQTEDDVISLCTALAKFAPSYYIYGNNEVERYYDNALTQQSLDEKFGFNDENRDPQKLLELTDAFAQRLEGAGVKVLKNSSDSITVGSTQVDIFGVLTSNPSSFWSYAGDGFEKYIYSNENNLKIMAIHEPTVFEKYSPDTWGDVLLAGHTHGGMARIPIIGPVYTEDLGILPARKGHFVYGRYDVQGRPLIVSSGLDNNTFLRINNQPEIVIVDINKF